MALASRRANADICYDSGSGPVVCGDCDGGFNKSICVVGCAGSFCSTSYGECCAPGNQQYEVQNPSGQCEDENCGNLRTRSKFAGAHVPAAVRIAEDWRGTPAVVLAPNTCSRSYDVAHGI
jgi:hypothetical protein